MWLRNEGPSGSAAAERHCSKVAPPTRPAPLHLSLPIPLPEPFSLPAPPRVAPARPQAEAEARELCLSWAVLRHHATAQSRCPNTQQLIDRSSNRYTSWSNLQGHWPLATASDKGHATHRPEICRLGLQSPALFAQVLQPKAASGMKPREVTKIRQLQLCLVNFLLSHPSNLMQGSEHHVPRSLSPA